MQHVHVSLHSEPLVCINAAGPHEDPQSGSVAIHTLQMRGLDYRVVKQLAYGHTAESLCFNDCWYHLACKR